MSVPGQQPNPFGTPPESASRDALNLPAYSGAGDGEQPLAGYESETPAPQYVLAGWWRRAGAIIIDGFIVGLIAIAIMAIAGVLGIAGFMTGDEDLGVAALLGAVVFGLVALVIAAMLYAPLMMSKTNGQTLGRMAVGTRVVRAKGGPMTFSVAMLREVALKGLLFGIASSLTGGVSSLLQYLWPLWDDENRALHDFFVDTRTVMANPQP